MLRVISYFLFSLYLSLFFTGCSSSEKKETTPEGMLARAQEYEKDERFEESIRRYQEVRSKFPYSPQALEAELAVGDVYYKQESYPEAQTAYQSFRDLHPKHPKIAYVYFRYAMSLYMQMPETVDRDMSLAPDTILAFSEVLKKFPQSEYVKEAQEKKSELIRKMAEKEMYVGDFYFKHKTYDSALGRYEYVIKEYSGIGFDEKALIRAAYSAYKIGDPNKARKYVSQLKETSYKESETRSLLKEIKL
jgi:outer membrane protein assembly factor BamD